jgi:hypothetical protein
VADGQQGRHSAGPDRGQQLRVAAPAKLARGQAADHHRGPGGQRGPQPQTGRRYAEQLQRYPGQQRRQHRLIDVTGLRVPGAAQEVQFVAVEPVPRRQRHERSEHDAAGPDHSPVERLRAGPPGRTPLPGLGQGSHPAG